MKAITDPGVNVKGLHPEAFHAYHMACIVALGLGVNQIIVRLIGAVQDDGSNLDRLGYTISFKYESLPLEKSQQDMLVLLKEALGNQYKVIYRKDSGGIERHFNVRFPGRVDN